MRATFMLVILVFVPIKGLPLNISAHDYTYPCGTRLIVYEDSSINLVSIQAWVAAGSKDEKKGEEGIAHLLEHMMFRGAEKGTGYMAKKVEALGGYINAYTSYDHTVYHLYLNSEKWKEGIKILASRLLNATFKEDEFEAEKKVVLEEIRMNNDDPDRSFYKWAFSRFYPKGHPYKHPIIGSEKTVSSFTLRDLEGFYRRNYKPWRITFIVVGNVSFGRVKDYLGKLLPRLKHSPSSLSPSYDLSIFKQSFGVFTRKDARSSRIMVAFPIPGLFSKDLPYLDLLSTYMTDGRTSPLVRELKERKRLFRSVYSYSYTPIFEGSFVVGGLIEVNSTMEGLKELLSQLYNLGFNEKRLERAKKALLSDLFFSLESLGSVARYLGYFGVDGGDWRRVNWYVSKIEEATLSDIESVYSRYIKPSRASVFILSPVKLDEKKVSSVARAFEKSRVKEVVLKNGVRIILEKNYRTPTFSMLVRAA